MNKIKNVKKQGEEYLREELEQMKTAALPLIKYLADKHHPHVTAIVTSTSVELTEGIMNYPKIMDFIND